MLQKAPYQHHQIIHPRSHQVVAQLTHHHVNHGINPNPLQKIGNRSLSCQFLIIKYVMILLQFFYLLALNTVFDEWQRASTWTPYPQNPPTVGQIHPVPPAEQPTLRGLQNVQAVRLASPLEQKAHQQRLPFHQHTKANTRYILTAAIVANQALTIIIEIRIESGPNRVR